MVEQLKEETQEIVETINKFGEIDFIAILDMILELQQRIDDTVEFCNYLLNNKEVEIKGERYYKHSCDDIITNAILERLKDEEV